MTLKSYLWGIRFGALLSLAGWALVTYYIDPQKFGILGQFIFYATLFLFLSGIFILMLTWARRKFSREEAAFSKLGMSFREGVLLSFLTIALLILQSFRVLTWWDGLLTVAGVFLAELYFLTK
ncbi:MAG: hypothetical protein Q7S18_02675 [bacterium]|nr:hypothetical protein [bacterium]